ncbi:MAG: hypothetical protein E7238_07500 [Sarcina sp.]|nr:hypothetical protein [Sarcina sp.]
MEKKRSVSNILVVRGAGDLATGTIHRLCRAGFPVLALETAHPMAIRRHVAFSGAVRAGETVVEGIRAVRVASVEEARAVWDRQVVCRSQGRHREEPAGQGFCQGKDGGGPRAVSCEEDPVRDRDAELLPEVPVLVDPEGRSIEELKPFAVVDAILAKKNTGTSRAMAPLTIALGPGFTAGEDVDYVIETMRGHNLGRIISRGQALPNTGVPGIIGGFGAERVIHAPAAGILHIVRDIGETVQAGETIAVIETALDTASGQGPGKAFEQDNTGEAVPVPASITGLIRGMIPDGTPVRRGLKIADIDPRRDQVRNCTTISDKARCIAGSVLELVCAAEKKRPAKKIGCVLMAAGWSRRFREDKLLKQIGGRPLAAYAMDRLQELAGRVPEADVEVIARRPELADLARAHGLSCTVYSGGEQSDTIRRALLPADSRNWAGCMFISADQPLLTSLSMERLLSAFLREPGCIHRLSAEGVPGSPVLFPAECFPALRKLEGDQGGRAVIRQGQVPVRLCEALRAEELADVDDPDQLREIGRMLEKMDKNG